MTKRVLILLLALTTSLAVSKPRADDENPNDILIIANRSLPLDKISISELKDFFLKKRASWRTGEKVIPVNAKEGTDIRKAFRQKVLELDVSKEKLYWQDRMIIAGEKPPPAFSNTQKAVFKLRGAVSYIYRKDFREGVTKILLVLK